MLPYMQKHTGATGHKDIREEIFIIGRITTIPYFLAKKPPSFSLNQVKDAHKL